ncbi:MAG: hypothetical protein H6846_06105 [Hyphomonas sp.]|nr:hypothetical protein [Hyphomonas sp.]
MTGINSARYFGVEFGKGRVSSPSTQVSVRRILVSSVCAALAGLACPAATAQSSNGYGEDGNWQFETSADTANKSLVLQVREVKKANGFSSDNYYSINYNIDGDYINCSVSSNVTGNHGLIDQFAPIGSPTLTSTPVISASSLGNSSDTNIDTTSEDNSTYDIETYTDQLLNGDVDDSNTALFGSDQSISDSSLYSSVSGSRSTFEVGSASGNGGNGSAALNSIQSNDGASLTSTINDSMACAFSDATGTGAANVSQ